MKHGVACDGYRTERSEKVTRISTHADQSKWLVVECFRCGATGEQPWKPIPPNSKTLLTLRRAKEHIDCWAFKPLAPHEFRDIRKDCSEDSLCPACLVVKDIDDCIAGLEANLIPVRDVQANALMMSAAPELLEALQAVYKLSIAWPAEVERLVVAAISKAEGR